MKHDALNKQRGISITGLIFILAIVGVLAVLGMKIVPTFMEHRAVNKAIVKAVEEGETAYEMRRIFNKYADTNYVSAISGADLDIVRVDGEYIISYEYQKKISLFGPASLVLDYEGSTENSGK